MRAIVCEAYGPPDALVLKEIESPELGRNAVRLQVHACGVNFPDTLIIEGKYQFKPEPPFTPGSEVAGVVIEIGADVRHVQPGDEVMALVTWGGYAEEVVLPASSIIPKPKSLSFVEAAAVPMAYGTSYHALVQRAQLVAGESLLVLGAAGGVGLAAVELGAKLGAKVIAAVGSDDKFAVCEKYGAQTCINYRDKDLKAEIKALTKGQGVDVIYDPVGGDQFDLATSCLAWKGRLLVVGFASGRIPELPINKMLLKGASLVGVFWGAFAMREPGVNQDNFMKLAEWFEGGELRPHVSATYGLEQVPQALNDMLARKALGKLIIKIRD